LNREPDEGDAAAGLCAGCRHAAPIVSDRGSRFWRCDRSFSDPRYPRFPRLPVLRCAGFEPAEAEPAID
jgi:hypothetical protein